MQAKDIQAMVEAYSAIYTDLEQETIFEETTEELQEAPIASKNYGDPVAAQWNRGYASYNRAQGQGREMTPPSIPSGYKWNQQAGTITKGGAAPQSSTVAKPAPAAPTRPAPAPAATRPAPAAPARDVVVKAAKGGVPGTLNKTTGKWTPSAAAAAAAPARPATTAAAAPAAQRPAGAPPSGVRPAPTATPTATTAAKPAAPAPAATATPAARPSISSDIADLRRMQAASLMRQQGRNLPSGAVPTSSDLTPKPAATPSTATTPVTNRTTTAFASSTPNLAAKPTPAPAPTPAKPKLDGDGTPMGQKRKEPLWNGVDLFDLVKGHLLDEGYAETEEAAIAMMSSMSQEWRDSILEGKKPLPTEKIKRQMKKKFNSDKTKDWYDVGRMSGATGIKAPDQ